MARAWIVLLLLAAWNLGTDVYMYAGLDGPAGPPLHVLLAAVILASFLLKRQNPVGALAAAVAAWLLVNVADLAAAGPRVLLLFVSITGYFVVFGKVVILFVLARGVWSALAAKRLRKSLLGPNAP